MVTIHGKDFPAEMFKVFRKVAETVAGDNVEAFEAAEDILFGVAELYYFPPDMCEQVLYAVQWAFQGAVEDTGCEECIECGKVRKVHEHTDDGPICAECVGQLRENPN